MTSRTLCFRAESRPNQLLWGQRKSPTRSLHVLKKLVVCDQNACLRKMPFGISPRVGSSPNRHLFAMLTPPGKVSGLSAGTVVSLIEETVETQFFLYDTRQKSFVTSQLNGDVFPNILNKGRSSSLGSFFF